MTRELEFHPGRLPSHVHPDEEADRKPINYAELAFRYRFWLAAGAVAGLLLGELAYLKLGPEYEATGQILVYRRNVVPLKEDQRALHDWGERSEHIALIMSPMILNKAVEIGKLMELPAFRESEDIVEDLLDGLQVKRSSGQDRSHTNVLNISYSHRDAAVARAVVQAVISAYAAYLEDTRNEKSNEVLRLAQNAHDEVLQKLRDKEREYQAFREQAPLQWKTPVAGLSADAQATTNVHQERVVAIEDQRKLNLLRRAELQSRLQAIDAAVREGAHREALELMIRQFLNHDGTAAAEQRRQQEITVFENRLLPLLLEEQKLLRDYGRDHPDVQSVQQSIRAVLRYYRERGIHLLDDAASDSPGAPVPSPADDFVQLYVAALHQELAELKIRDEQLAKLFTIESEQAKEVARFQAQEQALSAELASLRELWGQLVTQINQVSIERQGAGYSLKQIAPVKDALSLKRLLKFWGAGGMLGALLVAGLCVVRELRDSRLKDLKALRLCLRQPVLGAVVRFTQGVEPGAPLAARAHPMLRYLRAPHSLEAENFRSLRTALGVICETRQAKVIQVSSPEPGDGKTTTVANLAVAVAQSGRRVLLIDADLRRPSCHRLLGVSLDIGLSDVLKGEIAPLNAIQQSAIEHLALLTAGQVPANPAELLASPQLTELFRDVRDDYDLIFVDTPPLLAVSDPCIIARQTDGLLLVVRLGKNTVQAASRARELIQTNNMDLLGVVANCLNATDELAYAPYSQYYHADQAADEPVAVS